MQTLQQQVARWCTAQGLPIPSVSPAPQRCYCLPNGTPLTQSQWELYVLSKNVRKCGTAGKLKYCY